LRGRAYLSVEVSKKLFEGRGLLQGYHDGRRGGVTYRWLEDRTEFGGKARADGKATFKKGRGSGRRGEEGCNLLRAVKQAWTVCAVREFPLLKGNGGFTGKVTGN